MQTNEAYTYQTIIELIDRNTREHKQVDEDDAFHYESLENEVLRAILAYCDQIGIRVEGYDIRAILDAEDDDDEGVPPEGIYQALLNLQLRMTEREMPDPITVPPEVTALFAHYEASFWPQMAEIRLEIASEAALAQGQAIETQEG